MASLNNPFRIPTEFGTVGSMYSPPRRGGEAAHQENIAKPPLKAQSGWSFETDHPVRAFLTFDGACTPPVPEGEYAIQNVKLRHCPLNSPCSATEETG